MKQREYHIKIHSVSRIIIAFTVILCSTSILVVNYLPRIDNEILSVIQFLATFLISFYLASIIGTAKAKVTFTDEAFLHVWERKFLFSWEKNLRIPWETVDSYVFQEDRTFDSFIINLTTKQRYKISKLNVIPVRDDFIKLAKDFPRLSNEYRNGNFADNEATLIKKGKSIYASKSFKWAFYLMATGFVFLFLTKILNPESETPWSSLGIIGFGLLFYGLMIKEQRENN
jgi:hypothetical protein